MTKRKYSEIKSDTSSYTTSDSDGSYHDSSNDSSDDSINDIIGNSSTHIFNDVNFIPTKNNIQTIPDLIKSIKEWKQHQKNNKRQRLTFTTIEYERLYKIIPHLNELEKLIGMVELKQAIVKQIIYFVQDLHGSEMMNIVITGNPGTAKTTVCKILGKIYNNLGILETKSNKRNKKTNGELQIANRSDLIAGYLGQTAIKTKKYLEERLGSVVFIDEAYSIGSDPKERDMYAKECVDTLNQFLSEHRNIICIIAGYEKSIKDRLFSLNEGLERRFPWRFHINTYSNVELKDIFLFCVKRDNWDISLDERVISEKIKQNKDLFNQNGGDCEQLLNRCKIEHGTRIFSLSEHEKKIQRFKINQHDFDSGFNIFKNNKLKSKEKQSISVQSMYI